MNKSLLLVFCWLSPYLLLSQSDDSSSSMIAELSVQEQVDSLLQQASLPDQTFDSVFQILELALLLSEEERYGRTHALATFEMGKLQINAHIYDEGIKNIEKVIKVYDDGGSGKELMMCYKYAGIGYNGIGEKAKSIEQYRKALEIANDFGVPDDIARITNNIGIVHMDQGHFDLAKSYFLKGLYLSPLTAIQHAILNNLGFNETKRSNPDEALKYLERALIVAQSADDIMLVSSTTLLLSSRSYFIKDYEKSLMYAKQSAREYEKLGVDHQLIAAYNLIAMNYADTGRYSEANVYYEKCLALCKKLNLPQQIVWLYANMAFNDELGLNYKSAYDNLKIHLEYKDSLFSIEKNKQIEEALAKYEAEKKEKEIAVLEAEQIIQQTNVSTQKMIKNITLGISGLVVLILILMVFSFAQRLRNKEQLVEQRELINTQKIGQLLKDNEINTIKATIKGQEEEKSRIAKDLHDGVAGTLAAIKMKLANIDGQSSSVVVQNAIKEIDEVYIEVRDLSHNLTPYKVTQAPFINLIQNYIDGLTQVGQFEFKLIAEDELDIMDMNEKKKIDLYRIIQELIMNVFKHANASFAELQLTQVEKTLNVILEDNGIGFDITKKSKGIGLSNVRSRVELLNGEMYVDSVVGRGTIINMDIPLEKLDQVEVS